MFSFFCQRAEPGQIISSGREGRRAHREVHECAARIPHFGLFDDTYRDGAPERRQASHTMMLRPRHSPASLH